MQQYVYLVVLQLYNIFQSWEEADNMPRMEFVYDRILYARNLGYYKHKKMERAVRACHRLFGIKKPMMTLLTSPVLLLAIFMLEVRLIGIQQKKLLKYQLEH